MTKRASGKFARRAQDSYDTPPEAVAPLLPFLPERLPFCEPCGGAGALSGELERLRTVPYAVVTDIEPRSEHVGQWDAFDLREEDLIGCEYIITNPPWSRDLLHPMIEHFANLRPTWLLFDADWMHTRQAAPYLAYCHKIVSVGRVSWMGNGVSGFDNCAWYLFDANQNRLATEFYGREAT